MRRTTDGCAETRHGMTASLTTSLARAIIHVRAPADDTKIRALAVFMRWENIALRSVLACLRCFAGKPRASRDCRKTRRCRSNRFRSRSNRFLTRDEWSL